MGGDPLGAPGAMVDVLICRTLLYVLNEVAVVLLLFVLF